MTLWSIIAGVYNRGMECATAVVGVHDLFHFTISHIIPLVKGQELIQMLLHSTITIHTIPNPSLSLLNVATLIETSVVVLLCQSNTKSNQCKNYNAENYCTRIISSLWSNSWHLHSVYPLTGSSAIDFRTCKAPILCRLCWTVGLSLLPPLLAKVVFQAIMTETLT